ncbi:MAG TPA: aldo/keto reductase [Elusimicrobiota bacterium]|nr:aldo/keto reductase [Elusimicrobiota bacterium]
MKEQLTRRQFIHTSAILAGTAALTPWAVSSAAAAKPKRTAIDQVLLGKTGIRLSRLGIGTGVNGGHDQTDMGKDEFVKLVHYAYDHGITYIDTADQYATFDWIGDAIKGLPREKLFIQSKVHGQPDDVLGTIDNHRKTYNTDYIDSLLVHCMTKDGWTETYKRVMDGFNEAKEKKWIRAKGVSCHTLGALKAGTASDWSEVHLVRVNPQGRYMDGATVTWGRDAAGADINPVMEEIKTMHAKGRGVIGMKIFGNGEFTNPEDRDKSIRFAMACKDIDAVVIGFKTTQQIDEAIGRINRALAEV